MNAVAPFLIGNIVYRLADNGLANLLGLETLRHGTNLINYLGIRILGADPSHGGKATGSTKGWCNDYDLHNYFYLFKDSEFNVGESVFESFSKKIFRIIIERPAILVRIHTFTSGYNFFDQIFDSQENGKIKKCVRMVFSGIGGIATLAITPILRFRFNKIDRTRLIEDEMYSGAAYKTSQKVEAWRIGILGSLVTGLNLEWFSRLKQNPQKILAGVAQLTAAAAIVVQAVNTFGSNPLFKVSAGIGAALV